MKLVFCGTPQFAVPTLETLRAAGHEIALVVTQPDRPVGRDRQLTAPPVKQTALAAGIPVTQPEKIRNNQEFRGQLEAIAPDAIVVVAYGRLIPAWMLALPRLGCINLHASLLPKYRGAAPIQWAVARGETVTGNTTMLLEEGLDTGPILLQEELEIAPEQTAADLFTVLAERGAPLVARTLAGLEDGTVKPTPQRHEGATLAPILNREDGCMEFTAHTATELKNRWRGFQPWPGAFTALGGKKLIVHRMEVRNQGPGTRDQGSEIRKDQLVEPDSLNLPAEAEPGRIHVEGQRLFVACAGKSWLELIEVQLEGKKRLAAAEFLRGNALPAGTRLENAAG
ncbi:MAG: methionyl-tRNA formyltransferase [Terracidiphilus sp.]|jgi:methionyl-tRNA formyltransferase